MRRIPRIAAGLALVAAAIVLFATGLDRPGRIVGAAAVALVGLLFIVHQGGPDAAPIASGQGEPMADFTVVLRGYDRASVDRLVAVVQRALTAPETSAAADARAQVEAFQAQPLITLRGYDREQVDALLRRLSAALATQLRQP